MLGKKSQQLNINITSDYSELASESKRSNDLYEDDLSTKDRVNISKKEYLELLEKVKTLEAANKIMRDDLNILLKPFGKEPDGQQIVKDIFEGKATLENSSVTRFLNPAEMTFRIGLLFEVKDYEWK